MTHSEQNIVYRDTSHQFVGGITHVLFITAKYTDVPRKNYRYRVHIRNDI